jgi:hypothetical protein
MQARAINMTRGELHVVLNTIAPTTAKNVGTIKHGAELETLRKVWQALAVTPHQCKSPAEWWAEAI